MKLIIKILGLLFALLVALLGFAINLAITLAISYIAADLCAYFFNYIGNIEVIVWQMTLILFFSSRVALINLGILEKLPKVLGDVKKIL